MGAICQLSVMASIFLICVMMMTCLTGAPIDKCEAPIAERNEAKIDPTPEGWKSMVPKSGWKENLLAVSKMVTETVTETFTELKKYVCRILMNVSRNKIVLNNCRNITFTGVPHQNEDDDVFHFYCNSVEPPSHISEAPIAGRNEARIERTPQGLKITVTKSGWKETLQAVNIKVTETVSKELHQYFEQLLGTNASSNKTVLNNCLNITFRGVLNQNEEAVFPFYCNTPTAERKETNTDHTLEGSKIMVMKSDWEGTEQAVNDKVIETVSKELDKYFEQLLGTNASSNKIVLNNCLNITFRGVCNQKETVFQFYYDTDYAGLPVGFVVLIVIVIVIVIVILIYASYRYRNHIKHANKMRTEHCCTQKGNEANAEEREPMKEESETIAEERMPMKEMCDSNAEDRVPMKEMRDSNARD